MTSVERRNRPQSVDVLVVDDEDDIRELLELSLSGEVLVSKSIVKNGDS